MNMAKISSVILIILVFVAIDLPLVASEKSPLNIEKAGIHLTRPVLTNYSVGLWGGANFSKTLFQGNFAIANVSIVQSQFRFGRSFGLSGNLRKNDRWSFQFEFNVEQQGMFFEDQTKQAYYIPAISDIRLLNTDVQAEFIQNFYSFPIMANLHFGRVFKWYITGGACFSYLKTAQIIGEMEYDHFDANHEVVIKRTADIDLVPTANYGNDVSVLGGLGIIAPLVTGLRGPSVSLIFEARYYQGLLNVYKGEDPEPLNPLLLIDPDIEVEEPVHPNKGQVIRNSVFSFRLGVVVAI
ncbi:MAG: porin family protein [Bacteroidota bacterium]|nr:porin family protein [Bacteroidota bacterium]